MEHNATPNGLPAVCWDLQMRRTKTGSLCSIHVVSLLMNTLLTQKMQLALFIYPSGFVWVTQTFDGIRIKHHNDSWFAYLWLWGFLASTFTTLPTPQKHMCLAYWLNNKMLWEGGVWINTFKGLSSYRDSERCQTAGDFWASCLIKFETLRWIYWILSYLQDMMSGSFFPLSPSLLERP